MTPVSEISQRVIVFVFLSVFVLVFVMYLRFSVTPVSEISRRVTVARDSLRLVL